MTIRRDGQSFRPFSAGLSVHVRVKFTQEESLEWLEARDTKHEHDVQHNSNTKQPTHARAYEHSLMMMAASEARTAATRPLQFATHNASDHHQTNQNPV